MKTQFAHHLLATLLGVAFTTTLHAQLVADGGTTNVTTGIDLLPSDLTIPSRAFVREPIASGDPGDPFYLHPSSRSN